MAQAEGHDLCLLHVNYGQRTRRGITGVQDIADFYTVPQAQRLSVLSHIWPPSAAAALTDASIPVSAADLEKHRHPHLVLPVPQRAHAQHRVSWAEVLGAKRIYIVRSTRTAAGTRTVVRVLRRVHEVIRIGNGRRRYSYRDPIIRMTKETIIREGLRRTAPST